MSVPLKKIYFAMIYWYHIKKNNKGKSNKIFVATRNWNVIKIFTMTWVFLLTKNRLMFNFFLISIMASRLAGQWWSICCIINKKFRNLKEKIFSWDDTRFDRRIIIQFVYHFYPFLSSAVESEKKQWRNTLCNISKQTQSRREINYEKHFIADVKSGKLFVCRS